MKGCRPKRFGRHILTSFSGDKEKYLTLLPGCDILCKYFSPEGDDMDNIGRKALLFDVYGMMLTAKQREIYDLAVGEDMSLAEIAEIVGVSRQAVHDMIRRTDKILDEYEEKLGLAEKFLDIEEHLDRIRHILDDAPSSALAREIAAEIAAIDRIERK